MVDWFRLKNWLRLFLPVGKFPWLTNFKVLDDQPRRILCMTPAGLGDTIMHAPAIDALKQKFPDAEISVLVHRNRGGHEICRLMPSVDETIDLGLKSYRWGSVIWFMLGRFWKLLLKLRKKRFDLVVVFWPNPVRRLLLAGLGSRNWIYSNLVDDYPGEQDRRLLQLVGIEHTESHSIFQIPEPPNAEEILPANLPRPLIGVNPFCGMPWREWSKFEQLQQELLKLGGTIVMVGKRPGYRALPNVHNLVNKLTVAQLFWVIKQLDVFVTADSGPMHIGFFVGTPTVALFGPVPPRLRVPQARAEGIKIIYRQSEGEDIIHATQRRKLDNAAMQGISVEEVVAATETFLAAN